MTGRIISLNTTSGSIRSDDGHTWPFDYDQMMAYDVERLATGQLVRFQLLEGTAINVSIENPQARSAQQATRSAAEPPRYMGFEQTGSVRSYRFQKECTGQNNQTLTVECDLALFAKHRVGIQEGPALCLRLLASAADGSLCVVEPVKRLALTDKDMIEHLARRPAPRPSHYRRISRPHLAT